MNSKMIIYPWMNIVLVLISRISNKKWKSNFPLFIKLYFMYYTNRVSFDKWGF